MTATDQTTLVQCRARANEVMGGVLAEVAGEVPSGTLLCHWRVQKLLVERFAPLLAAAAEPQRPEGSQPTNDAERIAELRETRAEALEAFASELESDILRYRTGLDRTPGGETIEGRPRQHIYGKLWQTERIVMLLRKHAAKQRLHQGNKTV